VVKCKSIKGKSGVYNGTGEVAGFSITSENRTLLGLRRMSYGKKGANHVGFSLISKSSIESRGGNMEP